VPRTAATAATGDEASPQATSTTLAADRWPMAKVIGVLTSSAATDAPETTAKSDDHGAAG